MDNDSAKAMAREMNHRKASSTLAMSLHLLIIVLVFLCTGNRTQKFCCICCLEFPDWSLLGFPFQTCIDAFRFLGF
ncbi:hypothetical protein AB3S75_041102 [Citrus x aurantiifolia]